MAKTVKEIIEEALGEKLAKKAECDCDECSTTEDIYDAIDGSIKFHLDSIKKMFKGLDLVVVFADQNLNPIEIVAQIDNDSTMKVLKKAHKLMKERVDLQ